MLFLMLALLRVPKPPVGNHSSGQTPALVKDNPVSISGFLSDNQSKNDEDLQKYANCFCAPEISDRFAGNHQLGLSHLDPIV